MGDRDDEQDAEIESNSDDIEDNSDQIDDNRDDIDSNRDDIEDNQDDIDSNRDDIDSNRDDIDGNRGDIDAIDEFVLTPGEAAAAPGANPPSATQRLRIHVPNIKTTISAGGKAPGGAVREADTGAPNYDGFGVHTLGHVFVTASGEAADSTATYQSKGDTIIQSEEGNLWAGSSGQALVASESNALLCGGGGVVIAGGAAVGWGPNPEPDASTPKPPPWMSGFSSAASGINRVWAGMDAVVAFGTGVRAALAMGLSRPKTFGDAVSIANLALGNVGGTVVSALGAANSDPIGGTVIHGTGGVIVGSTHTLGLYSITGTTIASVLGVSIVTPSVGITGAVEVGIDSSSKIEVKSGNTLSLMGKNKTILGSRKAELELLGKKVNIGSDTGDEGATQSKTAHLGLWGEYVGINGNEVQIAGDSLVLRGDAKHASLTGKDNASVSGKTVTVIAHQTVDISGGKSVRCGAGEFALCVRDSKLWVGHIGERIAKKPGQPKRHRKKAMRERINADYEERLYDWKGKYVKGDTGIEFKKSKVVWKVKGNEFKMDSSKFKTGSLVWKK